jgi:hypothetical protein
VPHLRPDDEAWSVGRFSVAHGRARKARRSNRSDSSSKINQSTQRLLRADSVACRAGRLYLSTVRTAQSHASREARAQPLRLTRPRTTRWWSGARSRPVSVTCSQWSRRTSAKRRRRNAAIPRRRPGPSDRRGGTIAVASRRRA